MQYILSNTLQMKQASVQHCCIMTANCCASFTPLQQINLSQFQLNCADQLMVSISYKLQICLNFKQKPKACPEPFLIALKTSNFCRFICFIWAKLSQWAPTFARFLCFAFAKWTTGSQEMRIDSAKKAFILHLIALR